MDTNSTALTTSWLDAVRRVRSAAYQHFVQQVPQAKPARTERKLTDVIESALQDAGAKPVQPVDAVQPVKDVTDLKPDTQAAAQHVDRLI